MFLLVREPRFCKYARRFGWKPRAVARPRRGGRFLPLTDAKRPAFRGRRARGKNAAARAAARCVRAGLLTRSAASAAVAETRRRAVAEATLKLQRSQVGEAKRQAAARRKAERAWENEMRTLLLIAKMQRAGGAAMRAEFDATLAKVYELFDARLLEAERALSAAGPEASDAERHIVGALRKLRAAPSSGDPRRPRESGDRLQPSENDPGSRPPDQNREPRPG